MDHFTFQELDESESFDPLILYSRTPFTQAKFYGQWQTKLGREVKRFVTLRGRETVAYFQLIKYPFFRDKSYFYIPYGPITKDFSDDFFLDLKKELIQAATTENVVFIRLDFTPLIDSDRLSKFFKQAPLYTYHSANFQPRAEWFLDLRKSEVMLLKAMSSGTRYNIGLAGRKGITTEIITSNFVEYFGDFYRLLSETAKRNKFNLHQKDYYKNIFQELRPDNAYLTIAKYREKVLAMILTVDYGPIATDVFSGSSDEYRSLRPAYLAKWSAICHAKKLGNTFYNFGGISSGKIYRNWEGLTVFKKGFGGAAINHSDLFDIIVQPPWYRLYNLRKKILRRVQS